jgi:hypothetical protein
MTRQSTPVAEDLRLLAGPVALAAFAAAWNTVMVRLGRPTVSMGVRHLGSRRYGAVVVGGVIGGLLAHWFLDDGGGHGPR